MNRFQKQETHPLSALAQGPAWRLLIGMGLLTGLFWGCGASEAPAALFLRITADKGQPPTAFVVTVARADAPLKRVDCTNAQATMPPLSCVAGGVLIAAAAGRLEVAIKARDFAFVSQSIASDGLPSEGDKRIASIALKRLPARQKNADYATGFAASGGLEQFKEMAVEMDSELGPSQVVKFYIGGLKSAPQVYFQNTRTHPLHYTFVRDVLKQPISLEDFEMQTYHGVDRAALAGTLILYPAVQAQSQSLDGKAEAPLLVTFFPSDDLTPAQVALAHRLLEERIAFAPLVGRRQRVIYLPAGQAQETQLNGARDLFARQDIAWMLSRELFGNVSQQLLNPGLAYGTLKRLSPEELAKTVVSYTDIVILTRLPNTLPIVGGTITEERQTPLAHVNVAARSRGTPNIALLNAATDPRVKPYLGQLVRFEVKKGSFSIAPTTPAQAQEFWKRRKKDPVELKFDADREGLLDFEQIGFADSLYVGAKAANLAELSRLLKTQAPQGFAIPFYYYDRFMRSAQVTAALCAGAQQDCVTQGRHAAVCETAHQLCQPPASGSETLAEYTTRLIGNPQFQLDAEIREATLAGIRYHITHLPVDPAFGTALNDRVAAQFKATKVRLRSSTNAEDLDFFTGAGLYESVSAYATGDKSAAERVRQVWASVWNWRAFEERGYWNIVHLSVRMGVAVHQAFPDEAANGVLITQNIADPIVAGMYVNVQKGEVSVTNPEDGSLPEIFSIIPAPTGGVQVARQRFSSLSAHAPILTDEEITQLLIAASKVQRHFAPLYGVDPNLLALDLEFKFHGPERALFIKQARPYVQPQDNP